MKRLAMALLALAALALLTVTFLEDQIRRTVPATVPQVSSASHATDGFGLRLATRLANPPEALAAAPDDTALREWLARQARALRKLADPASPLRTPLIFLLGAAALGFAASSLLRSRSAPAGIDDTRSRVDELSAALEEQPDHDIELEAENVRLADQLQAADAARINTEYEHEDAVNRLRASAELIDELRDKLGNAQTDVARLHNVDRELSDLRSELGERDETIDELRDKLGNAQTDVARLHNVDRELSDLRSELGERDETIDELHEDVESWRTQLNTLEAEHFQLRRSYDEIRVTLDDKEKDGASLDKQIAELTSRLEKTDTELTTTKARADELADIETRLASWSTTVTTLEFDLRDRDNKLSDLRRRVDELEPVAKRVSNLEIERDGLTRDLEAALARSDRLEQETQSWTQTSSALESELADKDRTINDLEAELRDSEQLVRTAASRQDVMANEITALEERNAERAKLAHELLANTERQAVRIERLEDDVERWQDQVPALESEIAMRARGMASLREDLTDMVRQCGELKTSVDQWRNQFHHSETRVAAKEQEIAALAAELESERSKSAELGHVVQSLRDAQIKLDGWDSTIATFRAEIHSKSNLIATLRDELETAHEENAGLTQRTEVIPRLEADREEQAERADSLADSVVTLRAKIESLENDLADNLDVRARLETELDETKARSMSLSDEYREVEGELVRTREHDASLVRRIVELEQQLAESQESVAKLTELHAAAVAERDELHRKTERDSGFLKELDEGLSVFAEERASLNDEIESWEDSLPPLAAEPEYYEQRVDQARREMIDSISEIRGSLADASRESQQAQSLADELEREHENSAHLHALLDKDRELIETLRTQVRHLPDLEMGLTAWQSRVTELEEKVATKNRLIDQMNQRLGQISGRQMDADGWQDTLTEIANKLEFGTTRVDELSRMTLELRKQIDAATPRHRSELQKLQRELATSAETVEELEAELTQRARQKPPAPAQRDSGILLSMQKQLAGQSLINEELRQALLERDLEVNDLRRLLKEKSEATRALPVLTRTIEEGESAIPVLRRVVGGAKNSDESN